MKRIAGLFLILILLFTGCGTAEEEISTLYQTAAEVVLDCHRNTEMLPDGTYAYSKSDYDSEGNNRGGTYLVKADGEIKLSSQTAERIYLGERGVYTIEPSPESLSKKILARYGYDGTPGESVYVSEIKPEGASGNYPGDHENLPHLLPMTETDSGILLLWGSHLLTLSDDFDVLATEKLPGLGFGIFDDGETWVLCREKKVMKFINLSSEEELIREVPARFYGTGIYTQAEICAVHDGYAYAWDSYGVFRWAVDDPAESEEITVTEIADFMGSGIPGSSVTLCSLTFGDGIRLSVEWSETVTDGTMEGFVSHLVSLVSAAEKNGNYITLELAHALSNSRISQQVIAFNRTHTDVKITVNDYSRFNRADDLTAGVTRLRMDLETGILKPDILLLNDYIYGDMAEDMPDYFTDLYSLMTGEVKPEDLWNSVRSLESDGKLYAVGAHVSLRSLVGKTENLPASHWDFTEALDFARSLPDDASFVKEIVRSDAQYLFLRYQAKKFADADAFTGQEFLDFIGWMNTLPETVQIAQTGPSASEILAGTASGDSVAAEEGENLYYTDRILLKEASPDSVMTYLAALNTFGTADPDALTWIGYPTGEESGIYVSFGELLTVPAGGEHPDLAWEFAEWVLIQAGEQISASTDNPDMEFTSLRQPCVDYMTALTGTEVFFAHAGYRTVGRDLHESYENGRINGAAGNLYTFDSTAADALTALLDSPCMTAAAMTDFDLETIIREELNRAGTPEAIAEAIRSRAGLYLAERN